MLGDGESAHELVVFRVCTDPEPDDSVVNVDPESSVAKAHTNRSEPADLFEVQRRMLRIRLE